MTTRVLAYGIAEDGTATELIGAGSLVDLSLVALQPVTGVPGAGIDDLRRLVQEHERDQRTRHPDPAEQQPFRVRVVARSGKRRDVIDGGVLYVENGRGWTGGVLLDRAAQVPCTTEEGPGLNGPKLLALMKRTAQVPIMITAAERRRVAPAAPITPANLTIDVGVGVDVGGLSIEVNAHVEASSKGICSAMGCPRPICDRWCR